MSDEKGWAVITGASSGLGAIFADQLARRGLSLVLTGRNEVRLDEVAQRVRQITPHAVLPAMLERGQGGILNVASTIAFQPGPYQATYGASKAFVLSLSQALWAETRGTGVTVTALCPGPTETGFVGALGSDVSHTAIYKRLAAPEPVVAKGLRGLDKGKAVVVPGLRNRLMSVSGRLGPGWVAALVAGRMLRPDKAS